MRSGRCFGPVVTLDILLGEDHNRGQFDRPITCVTRQDYDFTSQKMIHPATELRFINNEIGYGVVAIDFIPKGTITWVLDKLDREFTGLELMEFDDIYQQILSKYCYRNNAGKFVLCWDNGKFVNHSFRSNCLSTAYDFELAVRDIHPGEELTDDYGYLNLTEPFRGKDEGSRRKYVYPDDLLKYHKVWDKKLLAAFKHITRVDQPLRGLLPADTWDACSRIAKGEEDMASILGNHFHSSESVERIVQADASRD